MLILSDIKLCTSINIFHNCVAPCALPSAVEPCVEYESADAAMNVTLAQVRSESHIHSERMEG